MIIAADPGELVAYGPLLLAVPVAMAAGLMPFLSPCCLPLVPGYLAYVTGTAGADAQQNDLALHSSLAYATPTEHEQAYYRKNNPRQQTPSGLLTV